MFRYILKRLVFAVPTWLLISVVIFGLSRCATGDAVSDKLRNNAESNTSGRLSDALYAETAHELGLDKPTFYFSILPAAYPDTFYKIIRRDEREALEQLIWQYGNWSAVADYYHLNKRFLSKWSSTTANTEGVEIYNKVQQLLIQSSDSVIAFQINELQQLADTNLYKKDIDQIADAYSHIKLNATRQLLFIPKFRWLGTDNQYHFWLSQFLKGNFGLSKTDQTVVEKIKPALAITFVLGVLSIILSFLVGIPLGVFVATHRHQTVGKWLMRGVFAVYSLPSFWLATLAAMFLTTKYYGLKIFPSIGFASDIPVGATVWQTIFWSFNSLILPVLCLSLHPIAVIARQMQGAIIDILKKEYIQTAKAKGLPQNTVIWHHAVRNALTPIITLLGQMIPAMITGAFSVELIFNLQGIGRTTLDAILGSDWSVVFVVLMLVSLVIILSNLLIDILYQWFNPRVSYE